MSTDTPPPGLGVTATPAELAVDREDAAQVERLAAELADLKAALIEIAPAAPAPPPGDGGPGGDTIPTEMLAEAIEAAARVHAYRVERCDCFDNDEYWSKCRDGHRTEVHEMVTAAARVLGAHYEAELAALRVETLKSAFESIRDAMSEHAGTSFDSLHRAADIVYRQYVLAVAAKPIQRIAAGMLVPVYPKRTGRDTCPPYDDDGNLDA